LVGAEFVMPVRPGVVLGGTCALLDEGARWLPTRE
jgi:hypothetical protein